MNTANPYAGWMIIIAVGLIPAFTKIIIDIKTSLAWNSEKRGLRLSDDLVKKYKK